MTTLTADSNVSAPSQPRRALRAALWTVQVLLAGAFFMAGFAKVSTPLDALALQMPWVASAPGALVRFIGAAEIAGALGLVLPALSRIKPMLTPLAAAGLVTIMVLASLTHVMRGELGVLPVNAVLGGLAAFVAYGRARLAPITARA